MSSASLAHARHTPQHATHPDTIRITALSAAMALNLAVLLIATRPVGAPAVPRLATPAAATLIRWISPPAAVPPPPAIELKPLPHPHRVVAQSPRKLTPLALPPVVPTTEGQRAAPPIAPPSIVPTAATPQMPATTGQPVEASLAYRSSPLQFPVQAMREHMHGTVLLRVLVDETGKPLDVVIERSSGYALLDHSARQQVLSSWRFQPAMVDGKVVRAWARVPVSFDLRQQ
ncbi:TonB family protein [Rhodanobacter sp. BL-MT-08]